MQRNAVVLAMVTSVTLFVSAAATLAQDWPNKPVKVIVPFPAGGPTDVLGRPVTDQLTKLLGQPFLIDNRAGGVEIAREHRFFIAIHVFFEVNNEFFG